jgi:hypothetical protein
MALTKTEELRKKAQLLLAQAKKIEEEAVTKLGGFASKFLSGSMSFDEFKAKATELGFEIKLGGVVNGYTGGIE